MLGEREVRAPQRNLTEDSHRLKRNTPATPTTLKPRPSPQRGEETQKGESIQMVPQATARGSLALGPGGSLGVCTSRTH